MPRLSSIEFVKITIGLVFLLGASPPLAWGQQFRPPQLPGSAADPLQNRQNPVRGRPIDARVPGQPSSGFVPAPTDGGFGLVPVQPRSDSIQGQTVDPRRPVYPEGRTPADEQLLSRIRSGNFEGPILDDGSGSGPQTIRQRYPDGKTQLMRQVIQDEDGNFYNHGPWQLYNRRGELMASGQFIEGLMDGTWERWHSLDSSGMFRTQPFPQFDPPFVSQATFSEGKLDGVWVILDRHQRKIVEVPYQAGRRNGAATWWYPNSERMRVINFKDGLLDGPLMEWDDRQQLTRNDEYIEGRKLIRETSYFRPRQKSAEKFYLDSTMVLDGDDNWWAAQPAEYRQEGDRVQHGPTLAWHANGQRKMTGQYQNDVRVGSFFWWHENGTRALSGQYRQGDKTGTWTWWHVNGIKSIEGTYENDEPVGVWTWWNEEGQVVDQEEFGEGGGSSDVLVRPSQSDPPPEQVDPWEADGLKLRSSPPVPAWNPWRRFDRWSHWMISVSRSSTGTGLSR